MLMYMEPYFENNNKPKKISGSKWCHSCKTAESVSNIVKQNFFTEFTGSWTAEIMSLNFSRSDLVIVKTNSVLASFVWVLDTIMFA